MGLIGYQLLMFPFMIINYVSAIMWSYPLYFVAFFVKDKPREPYKPKTRSYTIFINLLITKLIKLKKIF